MVVIYLIWPSSMSLSTSPPSPSLSNAYVVKNVIVMHPSTHNETKALLFGANSKSFFQQKQHNRNTTNMAFVCHRLNTKER